MAKEKREKLYYIVAAGLAIIAIFIDVYLVRNGGEKLIDPVTLAEHFTGSIFDWIGIITFNLMCLMLALGLIGVWESQNEVGSNKWNYISFVIAIGSILLIYA